MLSDIRLVERVPADHPLRAIRALADAALADAVLAGLNRRFDALYSGMGRVSIAPGMLLGATLLQVFFSVKSVPEACLWHDAAVDGADRLQPALSLVRRFVDLSACRWTKPSGIRRCSATTATGG